MFSMKIKNKNKSNGGKKFVCDFCGEGFEELWSFGDPCYSERYRYQGVEANFCFDHFRSAHDDIEAFDEWYKRFDIDGETQKEEVDESRMEDRASNSVDDLIANIVASSS